MTRVPVTVLTGFLGAGKTTVLNRILSAADGRRYAVIVNEFGAENIDGDLIISATENTLRLSNGCVCCTVRGDLVEVLERLAAEASNFDAILIETTGLADPAPIAQTFFLNDEFTDHLALDAIVTLVDAKHFATTIAGNHEASDQVALADLVVVNKIDLVPADEAASLLDQIRRLNPSAEVSFTERGDVPPALLFNRQAYARASFEMPAHHHHHDGDIASVALASDRPVDSDLFMNWVQGLMRELGPQLLRSKGILAFAEEDRRFVFHGVQTMLDGDLDRPWSPGEPRTSRLVFIGRNLDQSALEQGFAACLA